MNNLRALTSSSTIQMKQTFSRNMFRFTMLVQPLIYGTILYLMFKNSSDLMSHVIYGTGLMTVWGTIIYSSASDIDRERWMGTLVFISCAPVKFIIIMTGKIIGNVILGVISMVYSTVFLIVVFNINFTIAHPYLFTITMIISILSFTAISMLFATMLTLTRQARVFMNALDYPIYIICGLVFPISYLPEFLWILSYCLSPTWANILLQTSANGITDYKAFYLNLLYLTLITLIYFLISIFFFLKIDRKVRVEATLEVI